jgi:hypothetical protein
MALQHRKKSPANSSSSNENQRIIEDYSSDEGRSDIDHTYNPYSFKKLEQAIFKKPAVKELLPI